MNTYAVNSICIKTKSGHCVYIPLWVPSFLIVQLTFRLFVFMSAAVGTAAGAPCLLNKVVLALPTPSGKFVFQVVLFSYTYKGYRRFYLSFPSTFYISLQV